MTDATNTAREPVLRRRDVFSFAAALAGFGATLGAGSSGAMASQIRRPFAPTMPATHRPLPGGNPAKFQVRHGYAGPLGVSHY